MLFGVDEGWRAFNIGHCYIKIGRIAEGKNFLNQVVDKFSSQKYDWVKKRKEAALAKLSEVAGPLKN